MSPLRWFTTITSVETRLNAATATKNESSTNIVLFCTAIAR